MLDSVGEEICVDEDGVGRFQSGVVLEEEGGGDLGDFADYLFASVRFGGFGLGEELVFFEARIAFADDAFDLYKY